MCSKKYKNSLNKEQKIAFDIAENEGIIFKACDCKIDPNFIYNILQASSIHFQHNFLYSETDNLTFENIMDFTFFVMIKVSKLLKQKEIKHKFILFDSPFIIEPNFMDIISLFTLEEI